MLLVMIRSLNHVSINMEEKRSKIRKERWKNGMGREKQKERWVGGSRRMMGGAGSVLAFVIPHSTTIDKRVSQNTCCGIVFSGLPYKRDFCEARTKGWGDSGT